MKYKDLINFNPIDSVIQINEADDQEKAISLTKSYVMSDGMAVKLERGIINELQLDEVVDNKGTLLVGNYGTGKSHLMSVISAIAQNKEYLQYLQNRKFAEEMERIAGKFEVLRIEIGSTTMSLRNIIFNKIEQDFAKRGLEFTFPKDKEIINNKDTLQDVMDTFAEKYPDKGYIIVVDEFLDYLGGRKEQEIKLDLGFMREMGEMVKRSKMRVIFGMQEKLFENPTFTFVAATLNRVKDRFEQVIIRKEDTAYVVSERILKKSPEQKAKIRAHLENFSTLYSNMSEEMETYVNLFPIHPAYIDVFNKIYIIENRHILKNITEIIRRILEKEIVEEDPGVISFDSYWPFIKENYSYRADINIKEVVEKSAILEEIIDRSFEKEQYKPTAKQIIYALSVYRLTTGDISIKSGLTSENLKDDLCLYIKNIPENDSEFLLSVIQQIMKDIMTTVSGQFIEFNEDNEQYYLDLTKDIDFDEKISQKAAILDDENLNHYFFDVTYFCLDWNQNEHVTNYNIYEHTLNWESRNIYRTGYLFMGKPENRSTAQPPEDYYLYILPPYGNDDFTNDKKPDEVFFAFKNDEDFQNNLKLYSAALSMKEIAEEKNKKAYQDKAQNYRKKLIRFLTENKNTCFDVIYKGQQKQLIEVLKGKYNRDYTFKETIDLATSLCLDDYFNELYPQMPVFKTKITKTNQRDVIRAGIDHFAGRKTQQSKALLDSFGLIDGEKISVNNSKYAKYYIDQLKTLSSKGVLNFNDIYIQKFDDYLDQKFKISYGLFTIVMLALVHTGYGNLNIKTSGKTMNISASNLDQLAKIKSYDLQEFLYLSKPKDLPLSELMELAEILDVNESLIKNPNEREKGLEELTKKTREYATNAVQAKAKLHKDYELWGEPLISDHVMEKYEKSLSNVSDEFANFSNKYNTVAKLNNFNLTMDEVQKLSEDIDTVDVLMEYKKFKTECMDTVNYVKQLELDVTNEAIQEEVQDAKNHFRKIRDEIQDDKNGENAANKVNQILEKVKSSYSKYYMKEHDKKRLGVHNAKKKGDLIESPEFNNLKRLKSIDILSKAKFDEIDQRLSNLKVCYDLTKGILESNHICPSCKFKVEEKAPNANIELETLEQTIDGLQEEWNKTLLNTLSDPLVLEQEQYLKADQKELIDEYLDKKQLPNIVDNFFISTIKDLLEGFEPVVINTNILIDELDKIGPVDVETFKGRVNDVIAKHTKGKDPDKLRIVVKREV